MPDSSAPHSPAQAGSPAPGLRSFGGYEIEREVGRGGMGIVYLARQIKLNRRVALKMLTGHYGREELQRFLAEAETAAGLQHTNIAHIYEVGEHEGAPFYSMEYIESGSLADRLHKGMLPFRETVQLLISVARALHFAHQNGVVHRDMKPGNVLLDPDGVPKVTDFGIAKRLTDDSKLTVSGAVMGTPTYMAPEQARGASREVGVTADVYSLGAVLYEMLAGRPPFVPEDNETAIMVRVVTEDPVSPAWHRPQIPRDLETICMKCLRKEPSNRYASAAALAEDLRRFLDDEPILARPPTTAVRAVKWTRRHPWRTSLMAALLLGLGAGLERLWRWEFYERPHTEWSQTMDFVHGGAQPVGRLSAAQTSKLGVSYRFTRRGRNGPITRVEVQNPRSHPAAVRRIFGSNALANWFEGRMGAQENMGRETTRYDFRYSGDDLLETTGLDRNGHVTWRLLWDRAPTQHGGRQIARARFVDLRGFDFASVQGASHAEFSREAAGYDLTVRFFSGSGRPAANSEGVFGYRAERDAAGRITQLTNLDEKDEAMKNRIGIIAMGFTWNAQDQMAHYEYRDVTGRITPWNGVAFVTMEYDAPGNLTGVRRFDSENKPVNGGDGWALAEYKRNAQGEATEIVSQKLTAEGGLSPVSHTVIEYDPLGYPADVKMTGAQSWRIQYLNDALGNALEERLLDVEGHPVTGFEGWSIRRFKYSEITDPPGLRDEETYFDAQGGKTYSTFGGYHRTAREYDISGHPRREIHEDYEPARSAFFRFVKQWEFDAQGRGRKLISRQEDKEGQLVPNPNGSGAEVEFDANGQVTCIWQIGCSEETMGAPVWRYATEWRGPGVRKREVQQACDADRKPLPSISNGSPAHSEKEFSESNKLERIYETGFDEKLVGFTIREAKFTGGDFQSVTHKRSDGTGVEAVRVMVKEIFANAPSVAAELRAGDQLMSVNGNPVRTALEWPPARNFPGGWIEVLRDGHRSRIDGFKAGLGALGMKLEDRAPAVDQ